MDAVTEAYPPRICRSHYAVINYGIRASRFMRARAAKESLVYSLMNRYFLIGSISHGGSMLGARVARVATLDPKLSLTCA